MPTINVATGKVHHGFGAIQVLNPFTDVFPVPFHLLEAGVFVTLAE